MASKKTTKKPRHAPAPRKATARSAKEIGELAALVVASQGDVDPERTAATLTERDARKPGTPAYTLVVACFGHTVAKAAFSAEAKAIVARTAAVPEVPATAPDAIEKVYKGRTVRVTREADGLHYDGRVWKSLTAIALAVTGYKVISGPAFFGVARAAAKGGA